MKRLAATLIPFAIFLPIPLSGSAAEMKDMPAMTIDAGKPAQGQAHKGQGTVNSVAAKAGKVNLTHGPIATLNWPGMTMDFTVKEKQALAKLKPGQKVEFKLAEQSKGRYVITEIVPVK